MGFVSSRGQAMQSVYIGLVVLFSHGLPDSATLFMQEIGKRTRRFPPVGSND